MTDRIIKVLGEQATVNTVPSSFSNSNLLYVYNGGANAVATVTTSANTIKGSLTIPQGKTLFIEKDSSDRLEANTATGVLASPVAWGD